MTPRLNSMKWFLIIISIVIIPPYGSLNSVAVCQLSFSDGNTLYNFSLASPLPKFPYGVLSEDGFYSVAANESVLWFQLCDGMIFNHNPPRCFDCLECGGPSPCGMKCSALVANNIGGYHVCTTIGCISSTITNIIDKQNPHKGAIVKMSNTVDKSTDSEKNCSLSVSVFCSSNSVQGPHSLEKSRTCDYAAVLEHPAGCATVASFPGKGLGCILCLFGGYLMVGAAYRYFLLGVRGLDMIPNMDFWVRLLLRTQSFFVSWVRKFRGPTEGY